MRKRIAAGLMAAGLIASPALADEHSEIVNAELHAGYANDYADITQAHMHLHHSLNCLVGPNGAGYAPKEIDPCAHAGNGAIPDAKDPKTKAALEAAAKVVSSAIAETDIAKTKKLAAQATAMLKKLE